MSDYKEPGLGDVIQFNDDYSNTKYVIVRMEVFEDMGSVCYNRMYYIQLLTLLKDVDYISGYAGTPVSARGVTKLPFHVDENEAPFSITEEVRYKIRRKQPKTITVYE
jgi:hypothetical protein